MQLWQNQSAKIFLIFNYSAMIFLLLHIAIMAPPYVQGGGIGPNVYDKLNVASMGKVTKAF